MARTTHAIANKRVNSGVAANEDNMRIPTIILPLVPLLMSSILAILPAQTLAQPSATPKQRLCKPCTMPGLPIELPRHGMVLARGSFLSTASLWYTVDLERREVSRILARRDPASQKLHVIEQDARPIPPGDLVKLKQVASRIWADPDPLSTRMATDVTWDLWQLDGGDVRLDSGPGLPDGLANEAAHLMERLAGAPAHKTDRHP